jgi:hypothetical protein
VPPLKEDKPVSGGLINVCFIDPLWKTEEHASLVIRPDGYNADLFWMAPERKHARSSQKQRKRDL